MASNQTLDQILQEAKTLFYRDECAITARYVINVGISNYRSKEIPKELIDLRKEFDDKVRQTYPPRIIQAINSRDFPRAATLFSAFVGYVHDGRVPEYLEGLQEDIRKGNEQKEDKEMLQAIWS